MSIPSECDIILFELLGNIESQLSRTNEYATQEHKEKIGCIKALLEQIRLDLTSTSLLCSHLLRKEE